MRFDFDPGVVLTGVCDDLPIRRTGTAEAALGPAGDATGLVNSPDLAVDDNVSATRPGSVSRPAHPGVRPRASLAAVYA